MKKIVAYVGANKKESQIVSYIEKVIATLEKDIDIEFILYTSNNFPLKMCRGCNNCFSSHSCQLDAVDNMKEIKNNLLEADFIIFGSPVYMHNVSGGMKNFLDRIAYWTHIFALRGKNAMVIASASSNGTSLVSGYLENMLHFLGCPVVLKLNLLAYSGFKDERFAENTSIILDSLNTPVLSNDVVEKNFKRLKIVMEEIRKLDVNNFEVRYWEKHSFLSANFLSQIVECEKYQ